MIQSGSNKTGLVEEKVSSLPEIEIYPNPTSGRFQISSEVTEPSAISIMIFDAVGKRILEENLIQYKGLLEYQLDLSQRANGLYHVMIAVGENTILKKVILQK